ncbi:YitT family protein [Paenibacillus motobuensis]|uniref:YitT family protein n=1 Tax=Paenibacillus TaxID=44249 RepID=UPI00203CA001|nr:MULTISPECIES: YitT family protein [Paenibacillus]MCM3038824.1 YitT family protein [Paenibacillus lutimineralis]MCM3645928.1 YitT family protein [Paenibacillus motobuensis]
MKKRITDIVTIILGALIFALDVNLFVIPNDFGEGGVTGVTIILYYLFQWSPGLVNFIFNSILLVVGYKFLDRQTTIYTIIAVVFNSLFLYLTEGWSIASHDLMLNAVFGGIFAGVGIGLIIKVGGTTAGSTILARLMNKYLDWNVSYALLFFDLIVVFASLFIIGVQSLMFTIVMLFIGTKVMDFIIEGLNPRKAVMIVSKEQNRIAEQVNVLMERGVTVLHGHGFYTKLPQEILYIVINKQEISQLKKIVKAIDTNAFITIHDVRDVFGEGFMELSK